MEALVGSKSRGRPVRSHTASAPGAAAAALARLQEEPAGLALTWSPSPQAVGPRAALPDPLHHGGRDHEVLSD